MEIYGTEEENISGCDTHNTCWIFLLVFVLSLDLLICWLVDYMKHRQYHQTFPLKKETYLCIMRKQQGWKVRRSLAVVFESSCPKICCNFREKALRERGGGKHIDCWTNWQDNSRKPQKSHSNHSNLETQYSLLSSVSVSPSILSSLLFCSTSCSVTRPWFTDEFLWSSSTDFSRSLWRTRFISLSGMKMINRTRTRLRSTPDFQ